MEILTKSAEKANKLEVFFNKNTNKICYKDKNGIIITLNIDAFSGNASDVTYDNAISGLTATDIQTAIDEIVGDASTLVYDNTTSGNTATNVQAAIDDALIHSLIIAASDESTALTAGTAKVTFRMPYKMKLISVRASLTTAGSTSGVTTIDINEGGVSILSTKLTIDQGEKTSTTAATPAVISDSSLADDAEITIDIDGLSGGATETGLKVTLIGYRD